MPQGAVSSTMVRYEIHTPRSYTCPKVISSAPSPVTDRDAYKPYMENTGRIVARYGGRFIIRGGAMDVLIGETPYDRVVVIEFDSPEKARDFYDDEEYLEVRKIREENSVGVVMHIEGYDNT